MAHPTALDTPTDARPVPPAGSPLRPVRAEYGAIAASTLGFAAVLGVASAFIHVDDLGGLLASMIGAAVGAGVAIAATAKSQRGPEARMARAMPWPSGAAAEAPNRAAVRTAATMVGIGTAFIVVFGLLVDPEFIVFYAGINVVFSGLWALKLRRVVRIERSLGAELYRELSRPPRFVVRPRYYARPAGDR